MPEDTKTDWDQEHFDQKMKNSQNELEELRMQLNNLLVKFGLRALRVYQAARPEALKSNEIERLVKYELDNVIQDLSVRGAFDPVVKQARLEWEKAQGTQKAST
jgi:translation elongation factor EF-1beta